MSCVLRSKLYSAVNSNDRTCLALSQSAPRPSFTINGVALATLALKSRVALLNLHPEMDLLLCCARLQLDEERAVHLRGLLNAQLDWEKLLRLAGAHGLQPLLYHHLRSCGRDLVPAAQWQTLSEHYRSNAIRNHYLAGELVQLLRLFAAQGIAAIPFKGPALAADVYGDLALRRFCDLDIIVRRADVARAKDVLAARGYRLQPHSPLAREADHIRYLYHHLFLRADDGAAVELHWAVSRSYFGFPFAQMQCWERLVPLRLAGARVAALAPEDLLLLLCVHGAKHRWEKLEWVCGVAELTRAYPQLDWPQVLAQARALRSERLLLLGLRVADDLLGAVLPAQVRARCQADGALDELAARVYTELFAAEREPVSLPAKHGFLLKAKDSLSDRLRYLWLYLITPGPPEWHMVALPPPLTFLYRGLRLLRLVWIYGWILIRLFARLRST